MRIVNDGELTPLSARRGGYFGETLRGWSAATLDAGTVQRRGLVENFPRLENLHIWNLVARMLQSMEYGT